MDPATLSMIMQMFGGAAGGGGGAISNILGGLFSNPSRPYEKARGEMERYLPEAQKYLNPFFEAGTGAIPAFQQWLGGMKDPSGFINNLMGGYQESPYAKYQQEQGLRAAQNMGSASGLTGSTPLTQFAQQQAQDISSKDMNQWLQNVLGINTQYGAGQAGLMGQGMQAGGQLGNQIMDYMRNMAELAYGKEGARQGRIGGLIGGIGNLFGF